MKIRFSCQKFIRRGGATQLRLVRRLAADRSGAASTELGFLLTFVAIVAATGFVGLGNNITDSFGELSDRVETASTDMPNPFGGPAGGATEPPAATEEPPVSGEEPPSEPTEPGKKTPPGQSKK